MFDKLICAISIICLAVVFVLVLVLKDSLSTYFKSLSLSWSLGVRSLSLSLGVRSRRSLSLSWSLGVRSLFTSLIYTVRHSQHANTYRETDILANTYIRRKRRKVIQVSGEDHVLLNQDQDLSVRTQINIEHQRPKPRI